MRWLSICLALLLLVPLSATGRMAIRKDTNHTIDVTPHQARVQCFIIRYVGTPNCTGSDVADYNSGNDTVCTEGWRIGGDPDPVNNEYRDGDAAYNAYNPMGMGQYYAEELDADHPDNGGYVGFFIIRERINADILSKGWFGSDDLDTITYNIPLMIAVWRKTNSWNQGPHNGEAELENILDGQTRLEVIGGDIFGGGYAGSIQPYLRSNLLIENVGGGGVIDGLFEYNHQETSCTVIGVSGQASYSMRDGAGAQFGVSANFSFQTSNPDLFMTVIPNIRRVGVATSTAMIRITNYFRLGLNSNDMIDSWNLRNENRTRILNITEGS